MSAFQACVAFTLKAEGNFVNDSRDSGGATNMGITLATLSAWRGEDCTAQDVEDMTKAEAVAIYGAHYWNPVRGDDLPPGVDLMVFDHGVLAGVGRSGRLLQTLAKVPVDGSIGPQTVAAVKRIAPSTLVQSLAVAQLAYYQGCPGWVTFGKGWTNRVNARRDAALSLARAHA